ncbi:hypothetical protein DFH06DRAFT_1145559 [Mycena polygramma]|nr:hypothetical protein DFH06DRAFT_1145559 [Mycena polygramma]
MTPRVAEHSEDLGAAESADSAGLIGIGGGNAGDGTGTEGQRTIRTDRTCESWKAGKCREPGGNPEGEGVSEDERDTEVKSEKDRRDRRSTIEEEEDVEKRRMMTEATGGGRSIGSGETRKVNRDNWKRRKSRRRSKVDAEAHGGAKGRNVPERPKGRSSREGRKWEKMYGVVKGDEMKIRARAETGTKSRKQERCRMGYREGIRGAEGEPGVPKRKTEDREAGDIGREGWRFDLKQVKVVEEDIGIVGRGRDTEIGKGSGKWKVHISQPRKVEALHNRTIRRKSTMGEGKDGKMGSLPLRRVRTRFRDRASRNWKGGWKTATSSSSDSGLRPCKPEPDGRKEDPSEVPKTLWCITDRGSIKAEDSEVRSRSCCNFGAVAEMSAKTTDTPDEVQQAATRPKDLGREHGLETRRLVEGKMNANSSKVGSEVGSGEIREEVRLENGRIRDERVSGGSGRADRMEEAARGMGNRNNEKGRSLREVHGEDPIGRTTRRKSSTCSETTNSDSSEPRFGSEASEVGRCVRNRKSSAESVVGVWNPEEVLVQSESATNSSEEKSEIIGKARKFEMPIPPLRVDVPSSSTRFQLLRGYWGLTRSFRPKSQSDRRVKGEKLGEPETRQQERSGCRSATGWWSIQACEGPKEPRLPTRPKQMRECLEGFRWPELPKRNMTGRNRQTERVRKAMMDDGEYRRSGRGGKGNEAKTPRSTQRNKKSMEGLGKEKVNRKEQSNFQLRAAARSRNALNRRVVREAEGHGTETEESNEPFRGSAEERDGRTGSRNKVTEVYEAQPKTATVFGRRPGPRSERENGKETANGGEQPRTIPDASAEASIGRSEVTNGRLESEPRKGNEQGTKVQGTKNQVWNGSESSDRKETREGQREEVATGSTGAEQTLKSSAEGVTKAQMIWTRVGGWNVHEERETRRWTEQSSEGVVEPWEVSAGGSDRSSEDPNKSQEVEQLGRAGRNGQTELRNDAADLYGNATYELQQHTRGVRNQSRARTESSERNVPRGRGEWQRKTAELLTESRRCREVERFGNKDRRVGQSSGAMQQGRSDHIPTEIFGDIRICGGPKAITQPANCSSTREMSRTERTETECSEGNFAKSCEGNRRRAPKVAGGANRGLEGSTKRDSRLSGASETQGRKVTEIRESRRKIWPGPGEDVWDFGKDVRDPERPESFSGASLGNRKSQNTIRTSVRGELTGRYRVKAERQRKGSGTSRSDRIDRKVRVEAEREGEEGVEVEDEPNGTRRTRLSGTHSRSRKVEGKDQEVSEIRRPKSRKRPRWKRGSAEASETRSRYRRTSPDEGPSTTREDNTTSNTRTGRQLMPKGDKTESVGRVGHSPEIKGVRLSSLRLREEWKGGKEVVNDPDRSRSRGRAEDRRRPEISRVDGEVARADRSTEGQRPEVVWTEVGGRTGGEPEAIGTESK